LDPKGLKDFLRKSPKDVLSGGQVRRMAAVFGDE